MSTQSPANETPAAESTNSIRPVLAWGLLALNGLWLFLALQAFLIPSDGRGSFGDRAIRLFGDGAGLEGSLGYFIALVGAVQIVFPVVVVWLVTHLNPPIPNPKPYLIVAIVELGVSAILGLIAFFASFSSTAIDLASGRTVTEVTFSRIGILALLGLAIFWAFKVAGPHIMPAPQPYGAQGWQQGQAWGQPYGSPSPQQGWPQPGQPGVGAAGQQQAPQPGQVPQPGQQWPQPGQQGTPPQAPPPAGQQWPQA